MWEYLLRLRDIDIKHSLIFDNIEQTTHGVITLKATLKMTHQMLKHERTNQKSCRPT